MRKIGVISLGCDKNRVDTEDVLTYCAAAGFVFTSDIEEADALVVNTCAFIESAREESIEAILEASAYKRQNCRCLVVLGCLPMKYEAELKPDLPEVDFFLTPDRYAQLPQMLADFFHEQPTSTPREGRLVTTPQHYAYLKIADGCDNRCTYCTIPSIRGAYRSFSADEIVLQAQSLVDHGAKELILIAQDTTRYGSDRKDGSNLVALVERLALIESLEWIRLLYCYPEMITDELIALIAREPKLVKYLDIPLQHVDDTVLKRMNRRSSYDGIVTLIHKLRAAVPSIAIRTTLMVGFPGETEEAYERMLTFLQQQRLDQVGFFAYSTEEDTPSAKLPNRIPEAVKQARLERAYQTQQAVAFQKRQEAIGSVVTVRYEDIDFDRNMFVGRSQSEAPEIDSKIFFTAAFADVGQLYAVKITGTDGYDLIGEVIE